jgi:hypothetical protein
MRRRRWIFKVTAAAGSALGRFFHVNYWHGNYWHTNWWAKP